jgi:hypothetical protein
MIFFKLMNKLYVFLIIIYITLCSGCANKIVRSDLPSTYPNIQTLCKTTTRTNAIHILNSNPYFMSKSYSNLFGRKFSFPKITDEGICYPIENQEIIDTKVIKEEVIGNKRYTTTETKYIPHVYKEVIKFHDICGLYISKDYAFNFTPVYFISIKTSDSGRIKRFEGHVDSSQIDIVITAFLVLCPNIE